MVHPGLRRNPGRRAFRPGIEAFGLEPRALQAALPAGFSDAEVVDGLVRPTAMAFAPDGRIFVAEQDGRLQVVGTDGRVKATPFVSLDVANSGEKGLVGVVLDPDFANNQYVYLYRTLPGGRLTTNRVSRFTADGDVARPGSELVLLDIPSPGRRNDAIHNGGAMHFGPDGKLYIAVGDHTVKALAQSRTSLVGKILRIEKDGSIPRTNPFYRTARGVNRAIWATGFRNPFTFAFSPRNGRLFANEVGYNRYEEINRVVRGGNYGWPITRGPQRGAGLTNPIFYYQHGDGPERGCAITGGVFYETGAAGFPASYRGQYFFADFCNRWIRQLNPATGRVTSFATGLTPNVVDLDVGPDGALYYLARGEYGTEASERTLGLIGRIRFAPASPPIINRAPRDAIASVGQSASFGAAVEGTEPVRYQWQRDGVDIPGAVGATYVTPPLSLADAGARFRVVATNAFGAATSGDAILSVTSAAPPTARIDEPAPDAAVMTGQVVTFSGDAFGADGLPLPDDAFTWQVDLHHDAHFHPVVPPTSGTRRGRFTVEAHAGTGRLSYLITLTVVDPATGLTSTSTREIGRM